MTMIPILSVGTHSSRAVVWRGGHSHSRLDWVQIARSIEGGEKHSEIRVGTLYQTNSVMYLCGYMDVSTASDVNPTTESVDACYERRDMEGRGDTMRTKTMSISGTDRKQKSFYRGMFG